MTASTESARTAAAAHLLKAYDLAARTHAPGNPAADLIRRLADQALIGTGDLAGAIQGQLVRVRAAVAHLADLHTLKPDPDQDLVEALDAAMRALEPPAAASEPAPGSAQ